MKILNFGSLNIDYTYQVDHFVKPGETESSIKRTRNRGGKGLNQSIALAKAGAEVYHAGAVGKEDGGFLLEALKENNVHTDLIQERSDVPTGSAFIQVDQSGENCIVLDGGANQSINQSFIDDVLSHFEEGDWILLQNEINEMPYLIKKAAEKKMKVILNPSPMNEKVKEMPLSLVSLFLVNKEEASSLAHTAENPLEALRSMYPNAKIVMTLGAKGAAYWNGRELFQQNAYSVHAVDTTGAGDTFTGYFLACLADGKSEKEALDLAGRASAIACTRNGASAAIPTMDEVVHAAIKVKEA